MAGSIGLEPISFPVNSRAPSPGELATNKLLADPRGFEPQSSDSKSDILPLDEGSIKMADTVGFEPEVASNAVPRATNTTSVSSYETAVLYQTELGVEKWWTLSDSNRSPPACKAGALPDELRALMYF